MTKTAALYARQSVGYASVDQQLKLAARRAAERGWIIVGRFSDRSVSATSGEARPGYDEMISLVKSGAADAIVVRHYDRLYRQPRELEDVIDATDGVRIESVYGGGYDLGTADGRMQARVVGAFARGEVEKKAERQRDGALRDAEAGKPRMGTPRPFGWLADRRTRDPLEAPAVADACRAILAGGTVSGIARDWAARGLRPHQAPFGPLPRQPWTRTSVVTILKNPRLAGLSAYKGAVVGKGDWEPLVEEETWRAVVQVLTDPGRQHAAGVRTMLGGLARCRCGGPITSAVNQHGQRTYRCNAQARGDRPGPHVAVKSELVDFTIGEMVVGRLSMPDVLDRFAPKSKAEDIRRLRDEAAAIRTRLGRLGPLFVSGAITEADMVAGRREGGERLEAIEFEIADMGRESILAPLVASGNVRREWGSLSTDRRRAVVGALMDLTLNPAGRGVRVFDPEKVISYEWKEAV